MSQDQEAISILLDARKLGDGGIGTYIENLVDGLCTLREAGEIRAELSLLVPAGEQGRAFIADNGLRCWADKIRVYPEPASRYSLSEYVGIAWRHRHLLSCHQVYHSPHYTLPLFLRIPSVVTVHDVIHTSRPETPYHRPLGRALIRSAVYRAEQLITVSEDSKRKLERLCGDLDTPISVVPNAVGRWIGVRAENEVSDFKQTHGLQRDYLLFVGTERPHKGFEELVLALRELCRISGGAVPQLVVVGSRFSERSRKLVSDLGLEEQVRFLGRVDSKSLSVLYNGALAVVVPSKEEGFGLVALEAMASGSPVVCSPLGCLREVCGDAAWYTEGFGAEAICRTLEKLLRQTDRRREKAEQGLLRAQAFSAQQAARKTFRVYEEVLKISGGAPAISSERKARVSAVERQRAVS